MLPTTFRGNQKQPLNISSQQCLFTRGDWNLKTSSKFKNLMFSSIRSTSKKEKPPPSILHWKNLPCGCQPHLENYYSNWIISIKIRVKILFLKNETTICPGFIWNTVCRVWAPMIVINWLITNYPRFSWAEINGVAGAKETLRNPRGCNFIPVSYNWIRGAPIAEKFVLTLRVVLASSHQLWDPLLQREVEPLAVLFSRQASKHRVFFRGHET